MMYRKGVQGIKKIKEERKNSDLHLDQQKRSGIHAY
jgi:hypothetical protein